MSKKRKVIIIALFAALLASISLFIMSYSLHTYPRSTPSKVVYYYDSPGENPTTTTQPDRYTITETGKLQEIQAKIKEFHIRPRYSENYNFPCNGSSLLALELYYDNQKTRVITIHSCDQKYFSPTSTGDTVELYKYFQQTNTEASQ